MKKTLIAVLIIFAFISSSVFFKAATIVTSLFLISTSIAGPFNAHNAIGNANKIKKGE